MTGPSDDPDVGRMAIAADPAGAVFGVMTPAGWVGVRSIRPLSGCSPTVVEAIFPGMDELSAVRAAYVRRLEAALPRIVKRLSALPEVRRISVFGSFARGRRDLFTDLDLLVILDTEESVPERLARLYSLVDAGVDLDLLAWTPAEYETMRRRPFGRSIIAEEEIVYEA